MAQIIPAILTSNIKDLQVKLLKLRALTSWVQIDIMDGKFVPQRSIDVGDLVKIDSPLSLNLEIHLMVNDPLSYVKKCKTAKIKRVFFHIEPLAQKEVELVLKQIDEFGFQKGIALNPETPVERIEKYLSQIDAVLFLSVNPGKQGQKFINSVLEKVKKLKSISPNTLVAVDGGINANNINDIIEAGADYLSIGSAIVKSNDFEQAYSQLLSKIKK